MLLRLPRCCIPTPSIPVVVDVVKGRVIYQHSSLAAPLAAEIAVRLKAVIVELERAAPLDGNVETNSMIDLGAVVCDQCELREDIPLEERSII